MSTFQEIKADGRSFGLPPKLLKEHFVTSITDNHEKTCWGCGSRLLLPARTTVFKCGWCGAITSQIEWKCESKYIWLRWLRDRCFVCAVLVFMLFFICGGVWAAYPFVFSISYSCGVLHCTITFMLSVISISTFSLAAFRYAGTPPSIQWGSSSTMAKGGLDKYTFCHYCLKPKSPRTHHCRSCGMCILDMDHHCPFIGNCVGSANQHHFINFLIWTIMGLIYASIMSAYVGFHIWPPLVYGFPGGSLGVLSGSELARRVIKEFIVALLSSMGEVSMRGFVLVYLFVASISLEIGLSILLWQQLCYIYEGKTYLSHLRVGGDNDDGGDCQNLIRFFGFPYSASRYLPSFRRSKKST